jgi:putative membrane protein
MRILRTKRRGTSTARGIAAGIAGGLFASWVMNRFQAGLSRLQSARKSSEPEQGSGMPARGNGDEGARPQQDEPATVKAAVAVSERVFGHHLGEEEKEAAGSAVHYVFGAMAGGVYGAVAEHWPAARAGAGLGFGSALWLISDETAVPLAGLSKGPQAYPVGSHLSALAAHLVYGATTELVRRGLREGALAG